MERAKQKQRLERRPLREEADESEAQGRREPKSQGDSTNGIEEEEAQRSLYVQDYDWKKQAYNALVIQYGFSDTDASESLRTDEEIQVIDETREIEAESNRANILGDESFPKPARILGQSPDDFIIKLFGLAIILVGLNYMGVK